MRGGLRHDQSFVVNLSAKGMDAVVIDRVGITDASVARTVETMSSGVSVIVQAALCHERWLGRADALWRVEVPGLFGGW